MESSQIKARPLLPPRRSQKASAPCMVCVDRDFQGPGRTGPGTSCARFVRTRYVECTAAVKACCRIGVGHVTLNSALNIEREPHVQMCHRTLLNEICNCRQLRMRKRGGDHRSRRGLCCRQEDHRRPPLHAWFVLTAISKVQDALGPEHLVLDSCGRATLSALPR